MKTNRCRGFELLEIFGLPAPRFRKVRSVADIQNLALHDVPFGWTIRTCRHDGLNEFSLFNKNYLSASEAKATLLKRFSQLRSDEFYVVYESWEFYISMNIAYEDMKYIIEGNYSSQESISKGKGYADFTIFFPSRLLSSRDEERGFITDECRQWITRIVGLTRRIQMDSFYVEVAVTKERRIVFYELWQL